MLTKPMHFYCADNEAFDSSIKRKQDVTNEMNEIDQSDKLNQLIEKYAQNLCNDKENSLTVDSFYIGALKELHDLSAMIMKKSSKELLKELFLSANVSDSTATVQKFLNSLTVNNDYYNIFDCPEVDSFLNDAPLFRLLFADNCKTKVSKYIQQKLRDNNSREQRILYTVMNLSYFDTHYTAKSAINEINTALSDFGFEKLNNRYKFDRLIVDCILKEETINKEYNIQSNIGGMRSLTKLINEKEIVSEIDR